MYTFLLKKPRLEPDKSRLAKACDDGVARWRHSQVSRQFWEPGRVIVRLAGDLTHWPTTDWLLLVFIATWVHHSPLLDRLLTEQARLFDNKENTRSFPWRLVNSSQPT